MGLEDMLFWIGHASFYIKTRESTIFIDPFRVSDRMKERADLVLLTHAHFDHTSMQDIKRITKEDTKFIASNKCLRQEDRKHEVSKPGFRTSFNGIGIEAVAAYNNTPQRRQFHPKSENWVGYVLEVEDTRIYHAGDTDFIPEMNEISDIDIALLPMGGTYTMEMSDAMRAIEAIRPKTVVPIHYKMILGKEKSDELETAVRSKIKNSRIMQEVQAPIYSF